jgi:hypothetical protein
MTAVVQTNDGGTSVAIDRLVALAQQSGLTASADQWSEAFVFWFANPMPEEVLVAGKADPALRFFEESATPHMPANIGFFDHAEKIAVSFETRAS